MVCDLAFFDLKAQFYAQIYEKYSNEYNILLIHISDWLKNSASAVVAHSPGAPDCDEQKSVIVVKISYLHFFGMPYFAHLRNIV